MAVLEWFTRYLSRTCFRGLAKCCTSFHSKVPELIEEYGSWANSEAFFHWKRLLLQLSCFTKSGYLIQLPSVQFFQEILSFLILPQDTCWKNMHWPFGGVYTSQLARLKFISRKFGCDKNEPFQAHQTLAIRILFWDSQKILTQSNATCNYWTSTMSQHHSRY